MNYRTIKIGEKKKVALFCNAGLGNLINFTPVVAFMTKNHLCDIYVVNNQVPDAPAIFAGFENVDNVYTCIPSDVPGLDYDKYAFIIGSRWFEAGVFKHNLVFCGNMRHDIHEALDNFKAVIEAYQTIYHQKITDMPPIVISHNRDTEIKLPPKCIGIHAGWGGNREVWAKKGYSKWGEVAKIFWSRGYKTATFGTEQDRQGWEGDENNIDLIGKLSVLELGPVMRQLEMFVSANSGLSHYASGVGLKTTVLFGPTRDIEDKPLSDTVKIIKTNKCQFAPCKYTDKWDTCNNYVCMDFDPKEVVSALLEDSTESLSASLDRASKNVQAWPKWKQQAAGANLYSPKAKVPKILFICPGGQTLHQSPNEQLALLVAEKTGWEITMWACSLQEFPNIDISSYDLIWGDMDCSDIPSAVIEIAQKYKKPCYIHAEWVPPYRIEEGWEKYFNTKTQLEHRDRYLRNLEAMKKADLVSLALSTTPGGFDWIEKTLGYSFKNKFVRYPACPKYKLYKMKRKNQVATIARAYDPIKRVSETIEALAMLDNPPEYTIVGGNQKITHPKVKINDLGAWNRPDKVKIYSQSLIAVQNWSGIPPAEAIQQNCPIIGYDFDYMVELYGDMIDWVKLDDGPQGLARKIDEWLNKTQKDRDEWAKEKKKKFLNGEYGVKLNEFEAELVISKLKEIIDTKSHKPTEDHGMFAEDQIIDYWKNRAKEQGEKTVGFANTPIEEQNRRYEERKKFIFGTCPTNIPVLDYGCGIGRYACNFDKYVGIDITSELLAIAKENNPKKKFIHQTQVIPDFSKINFSMFFTATVLQHCPEEVVDKIIGSLQNRKNSSKKLTICLYENSDERVRSGHVRGRPSQFYLDIINKYFKTKNTIQREHIIHGEKHSILLVEAENRIMHE